MTRKDEFIAMVQTAAIVESVLRGRDGADPTRASARAALAVQIAIRLPEERLPAGVTAACNDLIAYLYHAQRIPSWLPAGLDTY